MSLRLILKATAPALVLAAISLVHSVPAAAAGDPARGQTLGYTCLGCHGVDTYKNVYPTFSVPRLRGQHVNYLVTALKAYRNGERSHGTMHAQASSLSDQDIEDIAAYLSGQAVAHDANAKAVGKVPALATSTCQTCHGPVGVPDAANQQVGAATLAGQHADYLVFALESYRNGSRKNGLMQPFAAQLTPADIQALATFYSQQKPALQTVPLKESKAK
ncbi:MAG TPA: c-type cytochrome [Steroidobacteraceae bacterium]|nr:c-type cytochrome [Steroidobacteraceae bacterium]